MKNKLFIPVIAGVITLVFITTIVGCTSVKQRVVANMMREIPKNTVNFSLWDIQVLRSDNDLVNAYEDWRHNFKSTLDDYNIVTDCVNRTGLVFSSGDGGCYFIYGEFNFNEMRDERDSLGFDADIYLDVEVWERPGELVALIDGLVITGDEHSVRDCIEVIKEDKDSLWDNQDAKDVVDMLPDGFNMTYMSESSIMWFEGEKAQGTSMEKKDKDTLKITRVFMFDNEDAAHNAFNEIEQSEFKDIKRNGKFLITITEVDIDLMYQ